MQQFLSAICLFERKNKLINRLNKRPVAGWIESILDEDVQGHSQRGTKRAKAIFQILARSCVFIAALK